MEKKNTMLLLLMILLMAGLSSSSADLLQNPDFESPPSSLPPGDFVPLNRTTDTLPGWSFGGSVLYVTAGKAVTLRRNGSHGVQLGPDGTVNQTFVAEGTASGDGSTYLLTVTLAYSALGGGSNCTASAVAAVSAPDSRTEIQERDGYAGKSFGVYLGNWGGGERVDVVIESVSSDADPASTCWPIVDSVLLKSTGGLTANNGNLLPNGGFELGPQFVTDSTEGVLLDQAGSPIQSPLLQWSILGTIKYIDSDHFFVPAGSAAIEIVSGNSFGIQTAVTLTEGSSYTLMFTLGDANDSCTGDLSVRAQAGSVLRTYVIPSNGTGSRESFSITFDAGSGTTPISFISLTTKKTKDGVFCGPIIDEVILQASMAIKAALGWNFMVFLLVFAAAAL